MVTMRQKFSLEAAGKLLGVGANAVRARAKKNPELYHVERDNGGKIWVWIDPENLQNMKASKDNQLDPKTRSLKASIEALQERVSTAERGEAAAMARADAAERARDQAESDRDHWRAMAESLAARRRWWPFR